MVVIVLYVIIIIILVLWCFYHSTCLIKVAKKIVMNNIFTLIQNSQQNFTKYREWEHKNVNKNVE